VMARVYSALEGMTAGEMSVQHFSLVVMADFDESVSSIRVGLLDFSDDETVNAIANFVEVQEYVVVGETMVHVNPVEMIRAMYAGAVDAIVVNGNFVQMFSELPGLGDIETDTRVLSTFEVETVVDLPPMDVGEPFSVLFLGTDSAQEGNMGGLMDSIILATFNLDELSFTMTSIPRDSYVQIPCFNHTWDKLAHATACGSSGAVGAVERMFDMEIAYYVNINFRGFMEVVDALGGITVDVPFSFWEQDSRRRSGAVHRIHVEAGEQRLDGEQALALARHRRTLVNGDFGRSANQQLVLEGILREIFTEVDTVGEFLPILSALGRNIDTNFTMSDITSLAQHTFESLPTLRGVDLMEELHLMNIVIRGRFGFSGPMSIVIPFQGAISRARHLMQVNLGLEEPGFAFTFSFNGFAPSQARWVEDFYSEPLPPHFNEASPESGIETPGAPLEIAPLPLPSIEAPIVPEIEPESEPELEPEPPIDIPITPPEVETEQPIEPPPLPEDNELTDPEV